MQGDDFLDALIAIAIILFILSVIVEKITQLIRQYSPFIKPRPGRRSRGLRSYWRNIRQRQTGNKQIDKKIEREVTSLSFTIGLVIAFIFKVDLIALFKNPDPASQLFWDPNIYGYFKAHSFWHAVLLLISIVLTGFFLAFGSKFFHDLVDTLLQIKNLKRKLVDEETYKVDSIEQLDEYLNKTYSDIIQVAIDQNRSALQTLSAVSPPMRGRMKKDGRYIDCIDIHLSGTSREMLPHRVQAKLTSGKTVNVMVHAIFDVDEPEVHAEQGDTAANQSTPTFKGTICCKINRDGEDFLLTCSHVFTGGTNDNNFGDIKPVPGNIGNTERGNFTYALCTSEMDIALLSPQSTVFTYAITPKEERKPVPSDIQHTLVKVVCRNKKIKHGIIVNDKVNEPVMITYNGVKHGISNLLVISNVKESGDEILYSGVTVKGDSGACVYDHLDRPIGMIIAGNRKFSFAIPIVDIVGSLSAKIIK